MRATIGWQPARSTVESFINENDRFRIDEIIEIEVITLMEAVKRYCGGKFPNLLTIDVEGWDYAILSSADFSVSRPDVICAEVVSGADTDSSGDLASMLQHKGYSAYFRTIGNMIFVANENIQKLGHRL